MATFISVRSCPARAVLLVLLLVNFHAWAREDVVRPPNTPAIGGPAGVTDSQVAIFYRTFQDAIYLARHTALYWPCDAANDEIFTRYFEPGDAEFVKNMFRAIANIDLTLDLSNPETVRQLADQPLSYNKHFTGLSIHFLDNHPGLTQPGVVWDGTLTCHTNRPLLAFMVPTFGGTSGLMSVCKRLYAMLPMLQDVETAPNWAIDPSKGKSNGLQYYDGYGCQNLGDTDSSNLHSTGSVMLHELMHFPGLFSDVPHYAATIPSQIQFSSTPHVISDFFGDWPKNGYGPYNSAEIKRFLPRDHSYFEWKPTYNADNYVSYAVSQYYSRVCGRKFGEAPSEKAAYPNRHPPSNPFP
ncbi:uncharacterized protein Z519_09774 [Cladophialophora bantiana CBS 173.52]|uniref:Lysine-specific metallo-endopeptidase domain-containing protein n=1 Tax=Cladophialophora bantiana (strain ATCC 10958 / CBS 173.52 / CDC B-1940 / NIH 8579) TaxID=1442370 RepID=A0A0D2H8P4_CLAB1|nr:uncharacterized protein Z519_09774 [Cladophialophora bantiana CBS 173.52]KIW89618.1 hypothetical protein Z519_09774 [Cladophialophora bantiana CBS 173.52]